MIDPYVKYCPWYEGCKHLCAECLQNAGKDELIFAAVPKSEIAAVKYTDEDYICEECKQIRPVICDVILRPVRITPKETQQGWKKVYRRKMKHERKSD